jgi:hypothetical protein
MKSKAQQVMDAIRSSYNSPNSDWSELERDIEKIINPEKLSDPRGRSHHVLANFEEAMKTFRVRNKAYGNNYKRFGAVMAALYNDTGWRFETPDEFNRAGIILQIVSKLTRYVADPAVGHIDSIHDAGVYCFMLEELDAEQQGYFVTSPDAAPQQINIQETCEHIWKELPASNLMQCAVVGCTATRMLA